jgi:hypothetical protein
VKLLEAAVSALDTCLGPAATDEPTSLMARARQVLASKRRPRSSSDAADENVGLVRDLWTSRPEACKSAEPDQAFARVLARIER